MDFLYHERLDIVLSLAAVWRIVKKQCFEAALPVVLARVDGVVGVVGLSTACTGSTDGSASPS